MPRSVVSGQSAPRRSSPRPRGRRHHALDGLFRRCRGGWRSCRRRSRSCSVCSGWRRRFAATEAAARIQATKRPRIAAAARPCTCWWATAWDQRLEGLAGGVRRQRTGPINAISSAQSESQAEGGAWRRRSPESWRSSARAGGRLSANRLSLRPMTPPPHRPSGHGRLLRVGGTAALSRTARPPVVIGGGRDFKAIAAADGSRRWPACATMSAAAWSPPSTYEARGRWACSPPWA